MSMGARLSLLGMYSFNNTLFDSMILPTEFDQNTKTTLINNILMECAELEVLYSNWDFLKFAIDETTTVTNSGSVTHSGTDSIAGSGNDSDVGTGYNSDVSSGSDTDSNYITSFDSNALQVHDQLTSQKGTTITHNLNSTLTHNHNTTDTTTYGHVITDTTSHTTSGNISGNIGVTTSQQMLEQELEITPKLNVMNHIIESFKNRFCLLVY